MAVTSKTQMARPWRAFVALSAVAALLLCATPVLHAEPSGPSHDGHPQHSDSQGHSHGTQASTDPGECHLAALTPRPQAPALSGVEPAPLPVFAFGAAPRGLALRGAKLGNPSVPDGTACWSLHIQAVLFRV